MSGRSRRVTGQPSMNIGAEQLKLADWRGSRANRTSLHELETSLRRDAPACDPAGLQLTVFMQGETTGFGWRAEADNTSRPRNIRSGRHAFIHRLGGPAMRPPPIEVVRCTRHDGPVGRWIHDAAPPPPPCRSVLRYQLPRPQTIWEKSAEHAMAPILSSVARSAAAEPNVVRRRHRLGTLHLHNRRTGTTSRSALGQPNATNWHVPFHVRSSIPTNPPTRVAMMISWTQRYGGRPPVLRHPGSFSRAGHTT
jgi:hypothetical protein